jgi:hypothetical protein
MGFQYVRTKTFTNIIIIILIIISITALTCIKNSTNLRFINYYFIFNYL